jgi:hypothetical protein
VCVFALVRACVRAWSRGAGEGKSEHVAHGARNALQVDWHSRNKRNGSFCDAKSCVGTGNLSCSAEFS